MRRTARSLGRLSWSKRRLKSSRRNATAVLARYQPAKLPKARRKNFGRREMSPSGVSALQRRAIRGMTNAKPSQAQILSRRFDFRSMYSSSQTRHSSPPAGTWTAQRCRSHRQQLAKMRGSEQVAQSSFMVRLVRKVRSVCGAPTFHHLVTVFSAKWRILPGQNADLGQNAPL